MREVAPGIYVETGYTPINVGAILTSDGWVCIDAPPFPHEAQAWITRLYAIKRLPILYLINTNEQRDRVLGNNWFDVPIIAHEHAAGVLLNANASQFISQAVQALTVDDEALNLFNGTRLTPPQISFTESMLLYCADRVLEIVHKPGPSRGSLWVALPQEQVMFVGDILTFDRLPAILDSTTKLWLEVLRELRHDHYADWQIIPGRGPLRDTAASEELSEYLRVARRRVYSLLRAGRPRAEVAQHVAELVGIFPRTPGRPEQLQTLVRAGLEAIYEELQAENDEPQDDE